MKTKLLYSCLALSLGAGAGYATSVIAQAKPEVLVKQRQAAMTLQGKYFGPLGGMVKGNVPYDAAVVARNAGYLDVLNKMPWDGFHPNTKDTTEKTRALPAIYDDAAKFKEAQEHFQAEVTKLVSVSKGGDEAAVKGQIAAVGKSCGGCHESFRTK